jgi:hypothetical protein
MCSARCVPAVVVAIAGSTVPTTTCQGEAARKESDGRAVRLGLDVNYRG